MQIFTMIGWVAKTLKSNKQTNFRIYNISNDSGIGVCSLETYPTGNRHNNSLLLMQVKDEGSTALCHMQENALYLQQYFHFHTTINCDDETII